ncbi:MAG: AMP-binding protein [Victivallales bacterium]|nr:AMP-binding protein [Victivallales bacterium]
MLEKYLPRQDFTSYEDFKANYRVIVPPRFNFAYDVVDGWAAEDDSKPALAWLDDHRKEVQEYTFGDMSRMSNQAANAFKRLGIVKGDVVMLVLKQRVEVWVCMLALHKIGAIVIPATFQLTEHDIVYRAQAANIKMIVTVDEASIVKNVNLAYPETPSVKIRACVGDNIPEGWLDMRKEIRESSIVWEKPQGDAYPCLHDTMLMYFTSGTAGMPKMILHDYTLPIGHIVTAKYWQRVEEGKRHMTASDSGWAKFAWGKIYGQWMCGAVIAAYDMDKFIPDNMLRAIEKLKLHSFCAPPTIYRFLIKEDLTKYDFSNIKRCSIAGEPLNPEVYNQWLRMTGLHLTEGFGQSETSVLIANFPWFPVKPGSTGKFSPVYDLELLDDNGKPCEDGVVGHIVIRHARSQRPVGLFREYFKNPEAMAAAWPVDDYDTGDTAWRDGDGYIWFEGRSDDVIKCSGYRIGPFEVESVLMEHPSVLECAVTAYPDPMRGEVVKATIVLAPGRGYEPSQELVKELQVFVKNGTAPYKYPRIIQFVDKLPKSISGKINRKAIREADLKALAEQQGK